MNTDTNVKNQENIEQQQNMVSQNVAFSIKNNVLNKALKILSGVVDHSQVIQILGYIKCDLAHDKLSLIASNSEIEIHVTVAIDEPVPQEAYSFTLPCRKLFDITRSLDADATLKITHQQSWSDISVGKTKFKLASLPASNFPQLTQFEPTTTVKISQNDFLQLLNRTGFAMASQDVRFFLNGMLLGLQPETMNAVATDGHRLALNALPQTSFSLTSTSQETTPHHFIVPRKTIHELRKHLQETDETITLSVGSQYMSVVSDDISIYSNLIDGQYPKYQKLIPKSFNHQATVSADQLRRSIAKMSILANEKFHGAKFHFEENRLTISTHNVNHEEASDELPIQLNGDPISMGFNLMYLVDILNVVQTDLIYIQMVDAKSSVSFEEVEGSQDSLFIVMPLSL